jgi:hypothetical protein
MNINIICSDLGIPLTKLFILATPGVAPAMFIPRRDFRRTELPHPVVRQIDSELSSVIQREFAGGIYGGIARFDASQWPNISHIFQWLRRRA